MLAKDELLQEYKAHICAMVCHLGGSVSGGHYIEMHKVSDEEWAVSDDVVCDRVMMLNNYMADVSLNNLIDEQHPNGWKSLTNLLTGHPGQMTPGLLFGRRECAPERPELATSSSSGAGKRKAESQNARKKGKKRKI